MKDSEVVMNRMGLFAQGRLAIGAMTLVAIGVSQAALNRTAGAQQIVSVDVGNIAVIEDDGTLVVPNGAVLTPDHNAIASAFFATHADVYDSLIIFTSSGFPGTIGLGGGFSFAALRAIHTAGINRQAGANSVFNTTNGLTRLLSVLNMNAISSYPADPALDFLPPTHSVLSGVELLGHEFEHTFAAYTQADIADILGRQNEHWSFFLSHPGGAGHSGLLGGCLWQDNADGTFTTIEAATGYSMLDEYFMGLRSPDAVPPFFVITPSDPTLSDSLPSQLGYTVTGTRTNLTVNNIININGPRMPNITTSMKRFRTAFVLVIPQGTIAAPSDLNFINLFQTDWVNLFSTTTENLGAVDTTLGLPVGSPLPFADTFDAGPNVDLNNWTYHQGTVVDSLGVNEPTGNSSLHLDGQWGGADELRSRTIDLSAQTPGSVSVDYSVQRGGGSVAPTAGEDLVVEYFNNLNQWIPIRTIAGTGAADPNFVAYSDSLPADAMHSTFRLRLRRSRVGQFGIDFGSYFVDNVNFAVTAPCVADLSGDLVVNAADLASLLAQWGSSGPADLTGDGVVNAADLANLLAGWGACP